MRDPRIGTRRPWFRWGVRSLLAIVFSCALAFGWVRWMIDGYQRDWQIEQTAIAAMKEAGGNFGVATRVVGPSWLRVASGPWQAVYFRRVTHFFFVASDARALDKHRKSFKNLVVIFQD